MPVKKLVKSLNAAAEGFIYVLKTERNMRTHYLTGLFFIIFGIYLKFKAIEIIVLSITVSMVLITEMINTAIELTVDIIRPEFHPLARIIKDVSAGAVLISAINAVIVGYVLFIMKMPFHVDRHIMNVRNYPWHFTFIALILVFGTSIAIKILFHKGTPFRGGMPSGHSAVAFAIWTIIAFFSSNSIVIALTFLMAFLIARHRVKDSVHTPLEVIAGALLGVLLTTLIFQIFR